MKKEIGCMEYIEAARVIAMCNSKNIRYVLPLLEKAGVIDDNYLEMIDGFSEKKKAESRGRKRSIDPEFIAKLKDVEDMGEITFDAFTREVYHDYGIQRSRIIAWMKGTSGITDDVKAKVMEVVEPFLDAKYNLIPKIKDIFDKKHENDESAVEEKDAVEP